MEESMGVGFVRRSAGKPTTALSSAWGWLRVAPLALQLTELAVPNAVHSGLPACFVFPMLITPPVRSFTSYLQVIQKPLYSLYSILSSFSSKSTYKWLYKQKHGFPSKVGLSLNLSSSPLSEVLNLCEALIFSAVKKWGCFNHYMRWVEGCSSTPLVFFF